MYSGVYFLVLVLLYHSLQVEGSCVVCAYMTSKDQCLDPFTGSYNDVSNLTKPIDMSLCRRYCGGYSVYCGSSYCQRRSIACKAGSIHHAYPAALLLAVFVAIVTAK